MSAFVASFEGTEHDSPGGGMVLGAASPAEPGVDEDLRSFGLSWRELSEGVLLRAQNLARSYQSPLYPATGPGLVRWLNTVRFLGELLLPHGWELSEGSRLQGKLIQRETRRALVVMSGDQNTGVRSAMPRSRYPKGAVTLRAIEVNETQLVLPLFPATAGPPGPAGAGPGARAGAGPGEYDEYETWFLLSYVTPAYIQSELSRGVGFDDTGRVSVFENRILLPFVPNDGTAPEVLPQDDGDDDDGGTPIEVPVQPR